MQKLWIVLGLSLMLCGIGFQGVGADAPKSVLDTPEGHYRQGMQKFESGDMEEARLAFKRALQLDPDRPEGYLGYALIASQRDNFEEAFRYVKTARKKNNKWVDVYLVRGRLLVDQEKKNWLKESLKTYREARKRNDRDDRVPFYEGNAYRKAGQYQDAENAYSQAIDLKGPVQAQAARALQQVQLVRRAAPGTEVGIRVAGMDPVTRADLSALLIDELKLEELVEKYRKKTYNPEFQSAGDQDGTRPSENVQDIKGHWAERWIERVLKVDVPGLTPLADGRFAPDDPVTRKEMAQVLQGLLMLITRDESLSTKYVGSESRFPDLRSDIYYYNAALWLSNGD